MRITLEATAELIPLGEATEHIPLNPKPHRSAAWRWAMQGLWIDGRVVKLRSRKVGGRRYTTIADIEAFLTACDQSPESTEGDS